MNIPYGRQWLEREEEKAVLACLRSDFITQGPKIGEFEKKFAANVGAKYAVAVSSGTAALHITALAIGLKPGDEAITTPMTFLATANAIVYAGAKPVFADIEPETLCIDPAKVKAAVTPKTKAVFAVHFGGHPAGLEELCGVAKANGLTLIEDASHALGARFKGSRIGDCRFSRATIFSFHPVKHITTAEGGMIVTNDAALAGILRELRSHGMTRDTAALEHKDEGAWYYEMQRLGFNYRMTDIQAALGIVQLGKLNGFVARRREIASKYLDAFGGMEGIKLLSEKKGCLNAYHLFVVQLERDRLKRARREIFDELRAKGLGVQVHYIPVTRQPFYRKMGIDPGQYPVSEAYYESAISLPIFPRMTPEDVAYVISTVKDVINSSLK